MFEIFSQNKQSPGIENAVLRYAIKSAGGWVRAGLGNQCSKDLTLCGYFPMKKTHIIALLLIVISMGVIVAKISDFNRFETFATATSSSGKQVQIIGELAKEKEIHYDPVSDANLFTFHLTDKSGETRKVIFRGTKPLDFERSEQVVVTGKMNGEEFQASKILMKCPSKYINDQLEVKEVTAGS